ncbi:MAG: hypothetical protein OSB62_06590 [Alphaproteobacteria bacterium]|nr:hypothetical protein [Alphaproteobacteria bacterium]
MSSIILKRRSEAKGTLSNIFDKGELGLIIHYSCESFYDRTDGKTPRVTAIVLRNITSAQTHSFSIHLEAELKGVNVDKIEDKYDSLEKSMLDKFFSFIKEHQAYHYVHWNMRDGNYGFQAIEQRYRVLGGNPEFIVSDTHKHDLSRVLISIYGKGYIGHPRLEKLIEKNHIQPLDFLKGAEEASAFENKEFVKLYQSTLRKTDILANIAQLAYEEQLKTLSTWKDLYGGYKTLFMETIKTHWIVSLIGFISAIAGIFAFLK